MSFQLNFVTNETVSITKYDRPSADSAQDLHAFIMCASFNIDRFEAFFECVSVFINTEEDRSGCPLVHICYERRFLSMIRRTVYIGVPVA